MEDKRRRINEEVGFIWRKWGGFTAPCFTSRGGVWLYPGGSAPRVEQGSLGACAVKGSHHQCLFAEGNY
jgi:hypothetical protein